MPAEPPTGWSGAQRGLHWATAALVAVNLGLGWSMVRVPFSELLLKFSLYQVHKTVGLTVLLLVLGRFGLLAWRGRPSWPPAMPAWRRRIAASMHVALYVALPAVAGLGYLTAASAPIQVPTLFLGVIRVAHVLGPDAARFEVLRSLHWGAAMLLLALAVFHATAAVATHRAGDTALRRMWLGADQPAVDVARN